MERTLVAGFGLFLLCIRPAIAETETRRWRIDVVGGALVTPWSVHLPRSRERNGQFDLHMPGDADFDTGGSYAVAAGYLLDDHFEVGGQFQHALSRGLDSFAVPGRRPTDAVPRQLTSNPMLDVFSVTVGTRVHLLPSDYRLRPWLVCQAGWYRAEARVDEAEVFHDFPYAPNGSHIRHSGTEDGFGFNVGGGLDIKVTRLLSIGPDVRYHRAVDVLDTTDYITTMMNLSFHF